MLIQDVCYQIGVANIDSSCRFALNVSAHNHKNLCHTRIDIMNHSCQNSVIERRLSEGLEAVSQGVVNSLIYEDVTVAVAALLNEVHKAHIYLSKSYLAMTSFLRIVSLVHSRDLYNLFTILAAFQNGQSTWTD